MIKIKSKIFKWIVKTFFKKNFVILDHNGEEIDFYPTTKGWYLIPFPIEKGIPYNSDNLATISRYSFVRDKKFIAAKSAGDARWGDNKRNISWRLDIMLSCISYALGISDENSIIVECGTGKGYMAAAICEYFKNAKDFPKFYLIDSFISEVPNLNGEQTSGQKSFIYADGADSVKSYFNRYTYVELIKGNIPEVLDKLPCDKEISFLHIDLNSAVAEKAAINVLKNKLKKGAIVLFDDYGGFCCDRQAAVHEAFADDMRFKLFVLPTGQAMYIHP